MSFDVATYSPSDIILTFGGYTIAGWDRITITKTLPSFRQVNGIRGKNTRIRVNNSAATIEIDLVNTSDTNTVFTEIVKQDEMLGGARLVVTVKDLLGSEVFSTEEGYIEAPATRTYEAEAGIRSWKINCLSSGTGIGSGSPLGSLIDNVTRLFS